MPKVKVHYWKITNTEKKTCNANQCVHVKKEILWQKSMVSYQNSGIAQMPTEYMQPDSPNIHFFNALLKTRTA